MNSQPETRASNQTGVSPRTFDDCSGRNLGRSPLLPMLATLLMLDDLPIAARVAMLKEVERTSPLLGSIKNADGAATPSAIDEALGKAEQRCATAGACTAYFDGPKIVKIEVDRVAFIPAPPPPQPAAITNRGLNVLRDDPDAIIDECVISGRVIELHGDPSVSRDYAPAAVLLPIAEYRRLRDVESQAKMLRDCNALLESENETLGDRLDLIAGLASEDEAAA